MDPNKGFYIESGKASVAEITIEAIRALPDNTIKGLSEEHPCSANWLDRDDRLGPRLEIHYLPITEDYTVTPPEDAINVDHENGILTFSLNDFSYEFRIRR